MSSSVRAWFVAAFGAVALAAGLAAPAQEQLQGDPERGEVLAYTCFGCHGIPNYKNAYPTYSVPKLTGQPAPYLASALRAYKSGERGHATMHAQAYPLSDQEIADVAAYLAGQSLDRGAQPLGQPPKAAELCVACHGANGVGLTPDYPSLAGQHADYLARALHDYKKGGRKNAIMAGFAAQLSDADIAALSEYYARQRPPLRVLAKPATALAVPR